MNRLKNIIKNFKENDDLMRVNHILAKSSNLKIIGIFLWIILVFILNYTINFLTHIGQIINLSGTKTLDVGLTLCLPRFKENIVFYILTVIIATAIDAVFIHKLYISYKDNNIGQKGKERFATLQEIQEQYKEIPDRKDSYPGVGGIPVARYKDKLYIDTGAVNNMYIGMTRSGKGEMFVKSLIDIYARALIKSSMVIPDMKLELYAKTSGYLKRMGIDVYCLNLMRPLESIQFNPLEQVIKYYEMGRTMEGEELAVSTAYALYRPEDAKGVNKFFYDSACMLFASFVIAVCIDYMKAKNVMSEEERIKERKRINLYSMTVFLQSLMEQPLVKVRGKIYDGIDMFFFEREEGDPAKLKFLTVQVSSDRTRSSILSTYIQNLSLFTNSSMAILTSGNTLDLEDIGFGERPVALFLAVPDFDKSKNIIASIIIDQIYFVNARKATYQKDQKTKWRIIHILDELGNFPVINELDTKIVVGLSRGFYYNLFFQSLQQAEDKYGDAAKTIFDNVGNLIYILATSDGTNKKISEMLGTKTITDINRNGKKYDIDKSVTENQIDVPLLRPSELRELAEGECVVIRSIKRRDNEGNKIKAYPIYANDKDGTSFKFSYEYLEDVNPDVDINELPFPDLSGMDIRDYRLTQKVMMEWHTRGNASEKVENIKKKTLAELNGWPIIRETLIKYQIDEFDGSVEVSIFTAWLKTTGKLIIPDDIYRKILELIRGGINSGNA